MFSNLRVFRDPIRPLWEVPQNRDGGKFVIILGKAENEPKGGSPSSIEASATQTSASGVSKDSDSEEEDNSTQHSSPSGASSEKPPLSVPLEYKMCLSLMVLGLLGPVDQFCGCVLSIRAYGPMLSIWTSSSADDAAVEHIRHTLSTLLHIPADKLSFQRHDNTIRNNTRALSKTDARRKMREARQKGDYIEPPVGRNPPRRKSESEKPLFHPSNTDNANKSPTSSAQNHGLSSNPSPYGTQAHLEGQQRGDSSRRGIHRSVSGDRLGSAATQSQGQHQPKQPQQGHSNAYVPPHGQGQNRQPTSPRSGTYASQAASPPQSHTNGSGSSHTSPTSGGSEQLTWREMAAQSKGNPKRTAAFSRGSNVHFGENVSVQTIHSKDAPASRGGSVTHAKVHPPAPFNIPDINITSGTPPPASFMMAAAPSQGAARESGKNGHQPSRGSPSSGSASNAGNDDSAWIPAGGHRANHNHGGSSGAYHQPFTSPRGHNNTTQGSAHSVAAKRRTQSASAGGQKKADPNYVSPEALFGADLPLISPSGTPMDSVPPSPPAELDDDDLAFLEEQRRLRQSHNESEMAQTLATKIKQLSVEQGQGEAQQEETITSPTSSGSNSARRRLKNQNRRNSSNDS